MRNNPMTRPASKLDVVQITVPIVRLRKHFANIRDLLEVNEALAQDNFSREQRSLSRGFYRIAATSAFLGCVGYGVIAYDQNADAQKKTIGEIVLNSAFLLTFGGSFAGRMTRPQTPPLSKEDRSNREKERQGRLNSYNAFYREHFGENPTLYTTRRFGA